MGRREGEIMVDHRASPGLPEDVARLVGYDPKLSGEGKLFEAATLTCSHCKNAVVKNPLRTRARENCSKCGNHYICDFCYIEMQKADYTHTPFDKKIQDTLDLAAREILGSPQELLLANIKETI